MPTRIPSSKADEAADADAAAAALVGAGLAGEVRETGVKDAVVAAAAFCCCCCCLLASSLSAPPPGSTLPLRCCASVSACLTRFCNSSSCDAPPSTADCDAPPSTADCAQAAPPSENTAAVAAADAAATAAAATAAGVTAAADSVLSPCTTGGAEAHLWKDMPGGAPCARGGLGKITKTKVRGDTRRRRRGLSVAQAGVLALM